MISTEKPDPVSNEFSDKRDGKAVDDVVKRKRQLITDYENIDPCEEQAFAEIGASADLSEWPAY